MGVRAWADEVSVCCVQCGAACVVCVWLWLLMLVENTSDHIYCCTPCFLCARYTAVVVLFDLGDASGDSRAMTQSSVAACVAVRHFLRPSPQRCPCPPSLPCLPLPPSWRATPPSASLASWLLLAGPCPPASCRPTVSSQHPAAPAGRVRHTSTVVATGTRGVENTSGEVGGG